MQKQIIATLLISFGICTSNINVSAETNLITPDEVITACEKAVDACGETIIRLDDVINKQDQALKDAEEREKLALKQKDSLLRNPFLWGAVGLILGVIIAK